MQVQVTFFKNESDPIAFVNFNEGIKGFHIPHGIAVAANVTQCVVSGKMGAFMRAPFVKIFADEVLLIGGDGTLRRRPLVGICPGPVEKYYAFCNENGVSVTEKISREEEDTIIFSPL